MFALIILSLVSYASAECECASNATLREAYCSFDFGWSALISDGPSDRLWADQTGEQYKRVRVNVLDRFRGIASEYVFIPSDECGIEAKVGDRLILFGDLDQSGLAIASQCTYISSGLSDDEKAFIASSPECEMSSPTATPDDTVEDGERAAPIQRKRNRISRKKPSKKPNNGRNGNSGRPQYPQQYPHDYKPPWVETDKPKPPWVETEKPKRTERPNWDSEWPTEWQNTRKQRRPTPQWERPTPPWQRPTSSWERPTPSRQRPTSSWQRPPPETEDQNDHEDPYNQGYDQWTDTETELPPWSSRRTVKPNINKPKKPWNEDWTPEQRPNKQPNKQPWQGDWSPPEGVWPDWAETESE